MQNNLTTINYKFLWEASGHSTIRGRIKTKKYGDVSVNLPKMAMPHLIVASYPNYNFALRRWATSTTDINEMADDFAHLTEAYETVAEYDETEAVRIVVERHVKNIGRIIDTDLATYISEMLILLKAFGEIGEGEQECQDVLVRCVRLVEKTLAKHIVITCYRPTPMGIQPYPVPYQAFLDQNMLTELPL